MPDSPVARYERVAAAMVTLAELACRPDGAGVAGILTGDEMVLARMRSAAEALRALGVAADDVLEGTATAADADLLRRAAHWQRFAARPAPELRRACGADIARGLLRVWTRRRTPEAAAGSRARLRRARTELLARVRHRCTALRAELQTQLHDHPAAADRPAAFCAGARRRAGAIAAELAQEMDFELGDAGPATLPPPLPAVPPVPAVPALERRLSLLLGAGFGTGTALTAARLLSELIPVWPAMAGVGGAVAGITLCAWVVRTRRLLVQRGALDRWIPELTTALRTSLEEDLAMRVLAAGECDYRPRAPTR